ncbi:hypothetical protein [Vulcanisaeta sp. JCM 16159]|nr:hypothetical protein [Vulcanisaeta sp. JCM 16159]
MAASFTFVTTTRGDYRKGFSVVVKATARVLFNLSIPSTALMFYTGS